MKYSNKYFIEDLRALSCETALHGYNSIGLHYCKTLYFNLQDYIEIKISKEKGFISATKVICNVEFELNEDELFFYLSDIGYLIKKLPQKGLII